MPSSSSSLINTIIPSTRLLLTSIIGSGSFARVYLAVDADHGSGKQQHQQQYAVKVLDKRGLTRDQVNSQHREVSIMAKLAHPHVIRLERVVETSRYLYLIMEWCEMDLYDAITQTAGFPPAIVKQVFDQLAAALEHCHQNGIYHRDIKPENALISPEYTVKLADFGLATNDSWSTEMGCGSVRYMAPECIDTPDTRARGYAPAGTDVWSLGVILINLLFGKNPWHEATPNDAIYAAYIGSNPNVLCDQFHITPEFDQLLRCLFQPDPLKRCSVAQARSLVKALPYFTLDHQKQAHAAMASLPSPISADGSNPHCALIDACGSSPRLASSSSPSVTSIISLSAMSDTVTADDYSPVTAAWAHDLLLNDLTLPSYHPFSSGCPTSFHITPALPEKLSAFPAAYTNPYPSPTTPTHHHSNFNLFPDSTTSTITKPNLLLTLPDSGFSASQGAAYLESHAASRRSKNHHSPSPPHSQQGPTTSIVAWTLSPCAEQPEHILPSAY